ncbi:MAG: hypothetical protein KatS3mg131_3364 [Candidatus Tectimicrobiota bacterium]|nr:MAG: hypothetical protein KatS3mg131_3364 [Candidatus Tectomicrobia bacterium]
MDAYLLAQLLNGLIFGLLYALIALGLTVVFGLMRVVNFAHGELLMLGGYGLYFLTVPLGWPPLLSLPLCMLAVCLVGGLVERLLLRPVYAARLERPEEYAIIVTFGLSLLLQNGALWAIGPYELTPASFWAGSHHVVGDLYLAGDRLFAAGAAALLLAATLLFVYKTWTGQALLATAQSRVGAAVVGIPVGRMSLYAMGPGRRPGGSGRGAAGAHFPGLSRRGHGAGGEGLRDHRAGRHGLGARQHRGRPAAGAGGEPWVGVPVGVVPRRVRLRGAHGGAAAAALRALRAAGAAGMSWGRGWLLGLGVLLAAAVPLAVQTYWLRVCATALYFIVLASSWNLLLGYAGQLSFAHAAFAGVGAYTAGLLYKYTGLTPVLGVLLGGVAAAGLGYGLGRMCLRLRGPYLALMTLGFSEILRLVAQVEYKITRGSLGLQVPYLFGGTGGSHVAGYYTLLGLTLATLGGLAWLVHSRAGLYLQAIREDEDAAAVMGVDVVRWKVTAFVVSSLLAGLAGGTYAHLFVRVVSPQMLLLSEMGLILAMAIVGGLGTLGGPVLGAVVLVFVQEQLRDLSPQAHLLLFALLVIVVMRFFRQGLYGLLLALGARCRQKPLLRCEARA